MIPRTHLASTPEDTPLLHMGATATSAPDFVQDLAFDSASADIEARYKRCASHWQPHLRRTRTAILRAAHYTVSRRKAVLLGAGLLHDIPLAELSGLFEHVLLVDIVHSLSCRIRASLFPNVTCVQADITGTGSHLVQASKTGGPIPRLEPDLFETDQTIDLTVSVNILSQLGCAPAKILRKSHSESEIRAVQRHFIESHLAYLRRLPGHSALITDFAWSSRPATAASSGSARRWDVLHGVPLPKPQETWDWHIAPAPESDPQLDFIAHVAAFPDWKAAHQLLMA